MQPVRPEECDGAKCLAQVIEFVNLQLDSIYSQAKGVSTINLGELPLYTSKRLGEEVALMFRKAGWKVIVGDNCLQFEPA